VKATEEGNVCEWRLGDWRPKDDAYLTVALSDDLCTAACTDIY